jgi:hypothetical protein
MSGRPRKQGLEFFPHDTTLSSDLKIEAVEAVHGIAGYGVYLKLLEIIYHEGTSPDLKAPATALALAGRCHLPIDQFNAILKTCVEVELFEREAFEAGRLDSNGIRSRLGYVEERRESTKQRQDKWRKGHGTTPEVTHNNPDEDELSRVIIPENGIVTRYIPTNGNVNVNKDIKKEREEDTPAQAVVPFSVVGKSKPGNGELFDTPLSPATASRSTKPLKERDLLRDALADSFRAKVPEFASPVKENSNLCRLASAIRRKASADSLDPISAAQGLLEIYWRLHESGKPYYAAFTPSRMLSAFEDLWAEYRKASAAADTSWLEPRRSA